MTSTRAISIVGTGLWKNVMRLSRWNRVLIPIRDPRSGKENERERIMKIHLSEMRSREERESDRERRERDREGDQLFRENARARSSQAQAIRGASYWTSKKWTISRPATHLRKNETRCGIGPVACAAKGKKKTAGKTKREREREAPACVSAVSLSFSKVSKKNPNFFFRNCWA